MLFLSLFLWASTASAIFFKSPLFPSEDDFYRVPANISDYQSGDIIDIRHTPVMVSSLFFAMNVQNSYQLLVRSEDSFGNPNVVVTTILEPYNADPSKLWSYQAWEDSNNIDCAPSYALLFKSHPDTITTQTEIPFIEYGLSKGWYVVVPDYQGPKAAFTAGIQAGKAVLNGIRSALNSGDVTGISKDAKVTIYGFSGGSLASGWAAQLQPSYAPELKESILGAAVGGFVTNITSTAIATDGTIAAGINANAINGIMSEYSMYQELFDSEINDFRHRQFYSAKNNCLVNSLIQYVFQRFFKGLVPYFRHRHDFFHIPEIAEIIRNNTLAYVESDGLPEIPLFIFHGQGDEIVPIIQPERAYENYCEWGVESIEYAVSKGTGHTLETFFGAGAAFTWLQGLYNGESPIKGCQRTVRTTNLEYPGADIVYHQILSSYVRGIFGAEIGEDTIDINDSTWLSKVIAWGFSKFFGIFGRFTPKRDDTFTLEELAGNKTVDEIYTGFSDVKELLQAHNIDPIKVLAGEPGV
ncbi:hypothetical protein FT663_03686 [Candidozyma haemuli var. vulneris]|uniref:Triacylglycerol lipase n=1 Tax=Candidozyma haemuli TaxID=45357 RepID=A0A2V1AT77_9ASCO|nr:hypothetical protein CXQ85_004470 [[Candida] haemuloni]KAF3987769.1 hypothetical protein FT662_03787 [[Candida] haemuloni var. vulneris]KAF3989264.1 hypothetical protein FT663_03686 [[Candida] haemuloni var. vulneris]PVH20954.1 hypothetical protein CXQ85_004470 [[Candida] haemuloni]